MTKKLLSVIISLKFNQLKKRLILKAPLNSTTKRKKIEELKLKRINLKSFAQQLMVHDMFGKHAVAVLFETKNGLLANDPFDVQINQQLGHSGAYNWPEIEVLSKHIDKTKCLYVIGTHIGGLLIPLSHYASEVVGIDANAVTFKNLERNLLLNKVTNATIFNYAVTAEDGPVNFLQSRANSGGSKVKPLTEDFKYTYDHPETISVQGKRLDAIQAEHRLSMPNFMVMDIEGYEFFALKGAQNCLEHTSGLYIEFAPHHLKDIAGKTLAEFLNLLFQNFDTIYLMSELIHNRYEGFTQKNGFSKIEQMYNDGISDDLLCVKQRASK